MTKSYLPVQVARNPDLLCGNTVRRKRTQSLDTKLTGFLLLAQARVGQKEVRENCKTKVHGRRRNLALPLTCQSKKPDSAFKVVRIALMFCECAPLNEVD